MPRYEVVSHVAVELDGEIPEVAAAVFRREFVGNAGVALRSLAVWPSHAGPAPTPLPAPLQQQLVDFFAAVARHAAVEEDVFRARVEDILGQGPDTERSGARNEETDTSR
jgi:hypothetical protein